MTKLGSALKSKDITLPTKVHIVKTGFSGSHVWMWELVHKKSEHWRLDAFKLWCWRRLLRVPYTARRSNQSIRKEISPDYSLEGLILKLKLQYFDHLMRSANSLEKTLMLGKIEGRIRGDRGWDGWMALLTQWTWVWANSGRWWVCALSRSVVSASLRPHVLQSARLLCPWDSPVKNGVGCHFLFQGIFLTQGMNPNLLPWQAASLPLSHLGKPYISISAN